MTERERQIMDLLRQDPMLSQGELAKALGITRSSVGVHLTISWARAMSCGIRRNPISPAWGRPTST